MTSNSHEKIITGTLPFDADVIKLEVPVNATVNTRVVATRQDRLMYYTQKIQDREELTGTKAKVFYAPSKGKSTARDTDAYALAQGWVSITPLSIDLTSRISFKQFAELIGAELPEKES